MTESRRSVERTMTTWDGLTLFYRAWLPASPSRKALLLFHGGHEHSARWQGVVDAVALDDVAIFAWDARGYGRSPGVRGGAESLSALVQDVDAFVTHVIAEYGIGREDMVVMAHSLGAVIVTAWVHDYAPPIRGLILATPAFRVKLYVPFAVPLLRLRQAVLGPGFVRSYAKARLLTHDRAEAERYGRDEYIFRQIAVNMLLDLHDTSTRLLADAGAIHVPTLMLSAGEDWVVSLAAQRRFMRGLVVARQGDAGLSRVLPRHLPRARPPAADRHCQRVHPRAGHGTVRAVLAARRGPAGVHQGRVRPAPCAGGSRVCPSPMGHEDPRAVERGGAAWLGHGFRLRGHP